MKLWWIWGACALGLSACGGGGGDSASDQTPFQVLVAQARSEPLEVSCEPRSDYSVLESFEVRPSASGQTVEAFDRATFHGSTDCTGAVLVEARVLTGSEEVPVVRIDFVSSLPSAQIQLLDGRRLSTAVDRVNVGVNPDAGVYRFSGAIDTQQTTGFTTGVSFTINNVQIELSQEMATPTTAGLGMAIVDGEVMTLMPAGDNVFVQTIEQ